MTKARRASTVDVVGVGVNSVDVVCRLPAWPAPSGPHAKMRIAAQSVSCGGQTATALATCARLGLRVRYIGAIGSDDRGARMRGELTARGIDLARVVTRDAPNHYAVILLGDESGERIVLWERHPSLALRPDELPVEALDDARVIHVDDVDEDAALRAARIGRQARIPVTSDLDRLTDRTEELVAAVGITMFAEHVPPAMTGIDDPERALRRLRGRHDGLLVVTLGVQGAAALEGDRFHHVPAFGVAPRDTTGAGDVFRGAFIHALLQEWPVDRMLRFACAAAAVSCTREGALNGAPTLEETREMFETGRTRPIGVA